MISAAYYAKLARKYAGVQARCKRDESRAKYRALLSAAGWCRVMCAMLPERMWAECLAYVATSQSVSAFERRFYALQLECLAYRQAEIVWDEGETA